jgi:hypothetical protein
MRAKGASWRQFVGLTCYPVHLRRNLCIHTDHLLTLAVPDSYGQCVHVCLASVSPSVKMTSLLTKLAMLSFPESLQIEEFECTNLQVFMNILSIVFVVITNAKGILY